MRKKVSCFSTRVWAGFLALLGFASCTSNEDPEDIPLEYGTQRICPKDLPSCKPEL